MHSYDDLFARNPGRRRAFGDRASSLARPNAPVGSSPLDEAAVLNLQRLAGNSAVAELLADGGDPQRQPRKDEEVGAPQPRLSLGTFASDALSRTYGALPDKSATEKEEETDQHVDVGTFTPLTRGLKIIAEISGGFDSADFPDGLKFTQTIDTNAPLHGANAPYVDPHPNDDMKPFYWTDVEQRMYPTTFKDHPSRNPPTGTQVTYWQATLALNGVDEANRTVTGFDYITYGFLMDAAGNVKLSYPQNTDGENHRQTLKNEWSSWTFN
jgi:hypothetical protein